MATEGRHVDATSAAATVESANFVRIVTRADGDALAASGVLASALSEDGRPFQITVGRTVADRTARAETGGDDEVTILLGPSTADAIHLGAPEPGSGDDRPITLEACDLVRELGATPDPVLALAGAAAAGVEPGANESEPLLERAREADLVERRPGVAVPTADPIDGLAHTTRCLAPWSGDLEATREALSPLVAESVDDGESDGTVLDDDGSDEAVLDEKVPDGDALGEDDHRRLGSLVALDVVGAEDAQPTAATAVATLLRPYETPTRRLETIRGFADVLTATARGEPGTGVALAMGHDVADEALDRWRDHGREAHEALDGASTGRYDGLFVVGIDSGPVETVAEIAVRYRSPEPVVLAIGDGEAALATVDGSIDGVDSIATKLDGATYDVGSRRAYLRYGSTVDDRTVIEEVRAGR